MNLQKDRLFAMKDHWVCQLTSWSREIFEKIILHLFKKIPALCGNLSLLLCLKDAATLSYCKQDETSPRPPITRL